MTLSTLHLVIVSWIHIGLLRNNIETMNLVPETGDFAKCMFQWKPLGNAEERENTLNKSVDNDMRPHATLAIKATSCGHTCGNIEETHGQAKHTNKTQYARDTFPT